MASTRFYSRCAALILVIILAEPGMEQCAWGQAAVLPSERFAASDSNRQVASGNGRARAYSPSTLVDETDDPGPDEQPSHAIWAGLAFASNGDAEAKVQLLLQAICDVDPEDETFAPNVNAVASIITYAVAEAGEWSKTDWEIHSNALGKFVVVANPAAPTVTAGDMISNLYLTVNGGSTGAITSVSGHIEAKITNHAHPMGGGGTAGSNIVTGEWTGTTSWHVTGQLQDPDDPMGGVALINEYLPGTMNKLYNGLQEACVDDVIETAARVNLESTGQDPSGTNLGFSISAWYSIH